MSQKTVYLILFRVTASDNNVYYLELDTGAHSLIGYNVHGGNWTVSSIAAAVARPGMAFLLSAAWRFCESPEDVLTAHKPYCTETKCTVDIVRSAPIGQRFTFVFTPPGDVQPEQPLLPAKKPRAKKVVGPIEKAAD